MGSRAPPSVVAARVCPSVRRRNLSKKSLKNREFVVGSLRVLSEQSVRDGLPRGSAAISGIFSMLHGVQSGSADTCHQERSRRLIFRIFGRSTSDRRRRIRSAKLASLVVCLFVHFFFLLAMINLVAELS